LVSLDGGITLRVTLPSGEWTQSQVQQGEAVAVVVDGKPYGFVPVVLDSKKQLVTVNVVSGDDSKSFSAVAWYQGSGESLMVVRRAGGAQSLLLLRPGEHASSNAHAWVAVSSVPLPIRGDMSAIRLEAGHQLAFRTSEGFGTLPVSVTPPTNKDGPWTLTVGAASLRPTTLPVNVSGAVVAAPVLDWSCHSHHERRDDRRSD
jgi:hypothetical protein